MFTFDLNFFLLSYNNLILIPRLYLFILFFVLLLICLVLTVQIINLIVREKQIVKFGTQLNDDSISINNLLALAKMYTLKKSWFSCIQLFEKRLLCDQHCLYIYCNAIGFCYYSMKFYDLSKTYYMYSISLKKDYSLALNNLAIVYKKMGYSNDTRRIASRDSRI